MRQVTVQAVLANNDKLKISLVQPPPSRQPGTSNIANDVQFVLGQNVAPGALAGEGYVAQVRFFVDSFDLSSTQVSDAQTSSLYHSTLLSYFFPATLAMSIRYELN